MYQPIFEAVLKLAGLALLGFALFRIPVMGRRVLKPAIFTVMNILFPLYFLHRLPLGWEEAVSVGSQWLFIYFIAGFVIIGSQVLLARVLVRTRPLFSHQPNSMIALFSIHNAGFIPLPIIEALAPLEISIYMFMFVLAFNIILWTAAVSLVSEGPARFTLKLNPPLIGLMGGIILANFNLSGYIPHFMRPLLEFSGDYALDLMLIMLGGVLATIPRRDLQYRPEFGRLVVLRFVLYPAVFIGIAALLPLNALSPSMQWGIRLSLILQAAVPPATNLLLVAKIYGTEKQVHYIGTGILITYLSAVITLPIFLVLATFLFR
ncbi:MAG: AEC family transporter [Spirochaetia bacterium]